MIFAWEPIWLVFSVVLITAIFVTITHLLVKIFTAEKYPAAVEDNIYMKLLLCSMFFNTGSVHTNYITYASDLGTVLDSLAMKNTVYKLVAFAGFVT